MWIFLEDSNHLTIEDINCNVDSMFEVRGQSKFKNKKEYLDVLFRFKTIQLI